MDHFKNNRQENPTQRILILGHTGFIGSHLEQFLCSQLKDIEITGFSSASLDLTIEEECQLLVEWFDLSTIVIFCAAIKKQRGDHLESFSHNVKISTNLCHLLENHPVKRFLYFSSAAVYGEDIHNLHITETTPVNPTSYYGMAKYVSERLFSKTIESQLQSSLLILRPPLVYGPQDLSASYGPVGFIKTAINREKITLWGDGTEMREFIFIKDLIEVTIKLIFHEFNGILNIASGTSYTFKDVLDILSSLIANPLQITSRPRTKQKADHGFENKVLMQLLPEFSFTSLESGVRSTFEIEVNNQSGSFK